jgi:hypothetical protein
MKSRYYIRVTQEDNDSFQDYLERNGIEAKFMSTDMTKGGLSMMYTTRLDTEEASTLRLSFNFLGFLNFNRALNRQVERRNAKIVPTTTELP